MTPTRILVVDDEQHIREVMQYALEREGFAVDLAVDGQEAMDRLSGDHDLIVLDVLMPELDGLSFCRRVRETSSVPIIFVSSRSEELDRVVGLELGGDDYLVKPFSPRELVARIHSILRRARSSTAQATSAQVVSFGPLVVDLRRHEVRIGDHEISMTATELAILHALLAESGRALSRQVLIDRAYTCQTHVTLRTMDTHVRRIRAKLRPYGLAPIETVNGVGYRAARQPEA